jgi:glutathione S-transferase
LAVDPRARRVRSLGLGRVRRRLRRCRAAARRDGRHAAAAREQERRAAAVRAAVPQAPPFLKAGKLLIGQTANILLYLGGRHGLAPANEAGRLWAHQLQLTIADLVGEAHDTHHPIASGLYHEDQRPEAKRRAADFLASRAPKYLAYFDRVLAQNPAGDKHLVGARLTYPDLSLFQIVAGLRYAFPRAMARLEKKHKRVTALHDRVAARSRIVAYLASERRIPFNEQGIFRHYPELDRT